MAPGHVQPQADLAEPRKRGAPGADLQRCDVVEEPDGQRDGEEEDGRRPVEREHAVEGHRAEEGVFRDHELEAHQQELDQRDEQEAHCGGDEEPADVLVVGAGGDLDPSRPPARKAVDDHLRPSGQVGHGPSSPSITPIALSWACWMLAFCVFDEGFVRFGRDDFDFSPHRGIGGAGHRRGLAEVGSFLVGAEDDVVDLAGDSVALAREVWDVPGVHDVGADEIKLDGGVDRDDELVVRERFIRIVVAPEPLLSRRGDLQRLAFERFAVRDLEPRRAGRRSLPGLLRVDEAEDEDHGGKQSEDARHGSWLDRAGAGGCTACPFSPGSGATRR